jgi:UDP-glucose 4-epimerase
VEKSEGAGGSGAAFIGIHLACSLLKKGIIAAVADDFSRGSLGNLEYALKNMHASFRTLIYL